MKKAQYRELLASAKSDLQDALAALRNTRRDAVEARAQAAEAGQALAVADREGAAAARKLALACGIVSVRMSCACGMDPAGVLVLEQCPRCRLREALGCAPSGNR